MTLQTPFTNILHEKVLVFDGATGTHLQGQNLTADDFGGEHLNGCNEYLVVSKPSAVEKVHADYLEAGCDVIETDTFGGASIVLAEYNLAERAYELNFKAAQIAKRVASDFSSNNHQRFVCGSLGPTTKLPSLGHISFKEMAESFRIQAKGLVEGGVDLLSVETCQDILQTKAALYGIFEYFEESRTRVPIIASVTIETMGTMLLGTEIATALTSLEPYDLDVIGMNCATGPKEMSENVRYLCSNSPKPVLVMPNAGLPENIGGRAHYHLSPEDFTHYLSHFVKDLGVNIVGGCCGTTKEHIRQLVNAVGNLAPTKRNWNFTPSVSSLYQSVPLQIDNPPLFVGERTNANGSKQFRDLLAQEDWEGIVGMGKDAAREGSHMVDVCAAYVGRNETTDMHEIITRFNTQVTLPIVIDSTEAPVIEEALQNIGGKAIINSINLEDGEERINKVVPLCKKYGAAVIALTIDEQGMAKTAEHKLAIAKRIYDLVVNKYKMKPHDLIFDTLTFTLGSGDEEFRRAGIETIEAIKLIKKEFPEVKTLLGVSNISFGLSPHARHAINSVFLHYAVEAGLDLAIVHAAKIMPLFKLDDKARELCRQLIFDERKFETIDGTVKCVYDPLTELMAHFAQQKGEKKEAKLQSGTIEERLKNRIIDGDKVGLQKDLDEALLKYPPLEIINNILLDGMKVVGDLFGSGQMQLPFVLQSAEVMKSAVAHLEQFMDKADATSKGTMVIATVKGDVHDIGKNLVDIILTNNGYKVINLGIKCSIETMLHAVEEHKADAIGMSGLLVKSTLIMKENLEVMNEREISIPVVLGGAALTRRYVEQDLKPVYKGKLSYANDAFDGLRFMEEIAFAKASGIPIERSEIVTEPEIDEEETLTGLEAKIALSLKSEEVKIISSIKQVEKIPTPPFWGTKVIEDISLDEVFKYINEVALFRGQWQVRKGKMTQAEYERLLEEKIYPEFESLKLKVKSEKLLQPKVVYGYFPCNSDGNDLIVYNWNVILNGAKRSEESTTIERREILRPLKRTQNDNSLGLVELTRFSFPRQSKDRHLCISDFFAPIDSGKIDVVAFHLVTMGKVASEYAQELFKSNNYKNYLYFHGLSVETTEALAEMWHKRIREELVIAQNDSPEIKKLFSQKYQGSRYSFGYPACPNLEDHVKLFELLKPERIGVELTEEFQLVPEQSTDAIIVHHPDARYFNV